MKTLITGEFMCVSLSFILFLPSSLSLLVEPDPSLGEDSSVSCIEAHLLFMCLRYADHCSSELMTTQLIENTVTSIQYITKVMPFTSSCSFKLV